MKRFYKLLVLAFTIFIAMSASAYDFMVDGICYNVLPDGNSVEVTFQQEPGSNGYITAYNNASGSISIPEKVDYQGKSYSVTSIGSNAFSYCKGFTGNLTIPNTVTSIGKSAFFNCHGLTGSLTIPNSVTVIGEKAFCDCSGFTGSLTIGNSVTSIGEGAFYRCSGFTDSLIIPNSVTTIGISAFFQCSGFTGSLNIPNSVTEIGDQAFMFCSGFKGSLTIPNSLTEIGNSVFCNCGFTGSLIIPNSVTSIGFQAFSHCSGLTGSLTIPNSVTSIGEKAFIDCSGFTGSLNIPCSMTSIGDLAFCACSGLSGSLSIPNSVEFIGRLAFAKYDKEPNEEGLPIDFSSLVLTGEGAFNLTSGSLPSISTVYIQDGVTGIKGLRLSPSSEIYSYPTTPPECDANSFTTYSGALHVSKRSVAAYFDTPYWENFTNIAGDAVKPESLEWEQEPIKLKLGEQVCLEAPILMPGNTGLDMSIVSLNPEIATISPNAGQNTYTVEGVKPGETDIIATCAWFEVRCHVTVTLPIMLNKHEVEIRVGEMETITPSAPLAVDYTVSTSDRSVATARVINGLVRVVGAKPGTATITVGSTDGYTQSDSCVVTVIRPRGDATKDGFTDVEDLNAMINVVLDIAPEPEPNDYPYFDLTGDGKIDVEDINRLINIMLDIPEYSTYIVNGVSFKMVYVEGGKFTMGACDDDSEAANSEKPAHQVTLSSYSIGETEVTQALWVAVMGSNPSYFNGFGNFDSSVGSGHSGRDYGKNLQRPVEWVNWEDCQTFITKLNQLTGMSFRLPTEAEWEYAARGGNKSKGYKFSGGNTIDDVAWYCDNIPSQVNGIEGYGTQTVGTKSSNELGLFDMSGNVWEWCHDWYDDNYSSEDQINPMGSTSGTSRVRRGGSLRSVSYDCRISNRSGFVGRASENGLRLAL